MAKPRKVMRSFHLMGAPVRFFFSRFKAIPHSPQRHDKLAVRPKAFPQQLDVSVQSPVVPVKIIAPDVADQGLSGQSNIPVPHQIEKEVVLFWGKIRLYPIYGNDPAGKIHGQPLKGQDLFTVVRRSRLAAF